MSVVQVILDGNFVHALRETRRAHNCILFRNSSACISEGERHDAEHALYCRMGEPAEILAKLLGAPVKCYVTRCSLLELKGLGAPFSGDAISLTAAA